MDPVDNYFYNYIDIQIRNFNDNPIPDFYVGVVDKVGEENVFLFFTYFRNP